MTADEPQGFLEDDANIKRLCGLGGVSRAGDYRHFGPHAPAREDTDLRDLIQRIALEDRHCGYRRVNHALRRQGLTVNAKRVLRLMRQDNLLSLRVKPFVPRTTDSRHGFAVRSNLTRGLTPSLLSVTVDRLRRWWRPGLICIGDSAHAMSPIGGVGINLAVQDAVAAANRLAGPLRKAALRNEDLQAIEERRTLPVRFTQWLQLMIQRRITAAFWKASDGQGRHCS